MAPPALRSRSCDFGSRIDNCEIGVVDRRSAILGNFVLRNAATGRDRAADLLHSEKSLS